jgi:hypothetical protein
MVEPVGGHWYVSGMTFLAAFNAKWIKRRRFDPGGHRASGKSWCRHLQGKLRNFLVKSLTSFDMSAY